MRRVFSVAVLILAACSKSEQPAAETPLIPPPSTAVPPAAVAPPTGTYNQAMEWFRTTRGFHFVVQDGPTRAEGDVVRTRQASESIRVAMGGAEWIAVVKPNGLIWYRNDAGTWKEAPPPADGGRIYQRVTLTLDPQKVEGDAQYVGTEGELNEWRFTNAITREVHRVWISSRDNHLVRLKIESAERPLELTISEPGRQVALPKL